MFNGCVVKIYEFRPPGVFNWVLNVNVCYVSKLEFYLAMFHKSIVEDLIYNFMRIIILLKYSMSDVLLNSKCKVTFCSKFKEIIVIRLHIEENSYSEVSFQNYLTEITLKPSLKEKTQKEIR